MSRHLERGQAYFDSGDYEKARVEYRNALQIEPNNAHARYLAGRTAEKLEQVRNAVGFYRDAIQMDPTHVEAHARLAQLYLFAAVEQGNAAWLAESEQILQEALAIDPDHPDLLAVRGGIALARDESEAAVRDAKAALASDPGHESALAVIATAYKELGRQTEAVDLLDRALSEGQTDEVDLRILLAQYLFELAEYDRARTQLDLVIVSDPSSLPFRRMLAQVNTADGKPEAAEAVLRQAIRDIPESLEARLLLIEFIRNEQSLDSAIEELERMLVEERDNDDLRLIAATFFERNGFDDRMELEYRNLINDHDQAPAALTARSRLAQRLLRQGEDDEAAALIEEVLEVNPRDNDALILRGNIALASGDAVSAITDLRTVLRDQPESVPLLRALAKAHLARNEVTLAEAHLSAAIEADPEGVNARLDLADLLIATGRYHEALPIVEEVLAEDSENTVALELKFRATAADENWSEARKVAVALQTIDSTGAMGHYFEGLVFRAEGDDDSAIASFGKALENQPDALEPLTELVRVEVNAGRSDEALAYLDDFLLSRPDNVVAWNLKGEVLVGQGHGAEAEISARTAIDKASGWWKPYRTLALSALLGRDGDGAIRAYRDGLLATGDSVELHSELAELLARLNRREEAITEYRALVEQDPENDQASNNLAVLLASSGGGEGDLELAAEISSRLADSNNPVFQDTFGWIRVLTGEPARAVPVLEKALATSPDTPIIHYHLGVAYYKTGDLDAAAGNLQMALDSGQNFNGVEDARATLAAIRER